MGTERKADELYSKSAALQPVRPAPAAPSYASIHAVPQSTPLNHNYHHVPSFQNDGTQTQLNNGVKNDFEIMYEFWQQRLEETIESRRYSLLPGDDIAASIIKATKSVILVRIEGSVDLQTKADVLNAVCKLTSMRFG